MAYELSNISSNGSNYTLTNVLSPEFLVYSTVRLMQAIMMIFGNALTIIAVVKYENLQTNANMFIANLAVADLLSAFTSPVELAITLSERSYVTWNFLCDMKPIFGSLTLQMNCFFVLFISLDRYIFIKFPLTYIHKVTKLKIWLGIVAVYILAIACMIASPFSKHSPVVTFCDIPFVAPSSDCTVLLIMWILVTACLAAANFGISSIAHRQQKEIGRQFTNSTSNEMKIIKMLMMVLGIFVVTYMPYILIVFLQPILQISPDNYRTISYIVTPFLWLNGTVNPIIYAWKDRTFRKTFFRLLGYQPRNRRVHPKVTWVSHTDCDTSVSLTGV